MNLLVKAAVAAAAVGVTVLAAAGCAARAAAPQRGSVQACITFGVRAIEAHRTVTQVPAACRGLSRAEVNFALGRSIYLVAGSGRHKVAWRHDAAVAGARLARLITTAMAQSPGGSLAGAGAGGRAGPVDRRPLAVATLIAWLLTMAAGGYMLLPFVLSGGLRRQRAAGDRTSPAVVLTHVGLASAGLLLWAVYLATSWLPLAWAAVGLLLPVIGFGMATLIVWTIGTPRSRAAASARTPETSDAPSGPSPASADPSPTSAGPSRTSSASAGLAETSSVSAEPSRPGPEPSRPGTEPSPAAPGPVTPAAPGPVTTASAPGQVQLAEARAQEAAGQPSPAKRPSRWPTVIIPITHGLLASATILLALLTALGAT